MSRTSFRENQRLVRRGVLALRRGTARFTDAAAWKNAQVCYLLVVGISDLPKLA